MTVKKEAKSSRPCQCASYRLRDHEEANEHPENAADQMEKETTTPSLERRGPFR
jgi:hypothetical protein